MKHMKKAMYVQKYKDAKHLSTQQINEESYQSDSSGDNEEEGEEEYGEEHEGQETDMAGGGSNFRRTSTMGAASNN